MENRRSDWHRIGGEQFFFLDLAKYAVLYREIVFDVRYPAPRDHYFAIELALTECPMGCPGLRNRVRRYLNNNRERLRLHGRPL